MKLIINISDKVYEGVKALIAINFGGRFSGKGLAHDSLRAIKNGVPLDDVKAKIKRMEYHMIDCDVLVSQEEVLEIIDSIGERGKE